MITTVTAIGRAAVATLICLPGRIQAARPVPHDHNGGLLERLVVHSSCPCSGSGVGAARYEATLTPRNKHPVWCRGMVDAQPLVGSLIKSVLGRLNEGVCARLSLILCARRWMRSVSWPSVPTSPGPEAHRPCLDRPWPTRPGLFHTPDKLGLSRFLRKRGGESCQGWVQTGATFADAAAEYMRWLEHRARKPSTLRDYESIIRAHLLPAFGDERLEDITTEQVEAWSSRLAGVGDGQPHATKDPYGPPGVMGRAKRVWKLPRNPITDVEKPVQTKSTGIEVFSSEEIQALVRAADSEQDAAIYLTAAYWSMSRRADRAALAERGFSQAAHTGRCLVYRADAFDAKVWPRQICPHGTSSRRSTCAAHQPT